MRCTKCGTDNREGLKFCTNCGTPFLAACPKCGAATEPDEKFCGECGSALGDAAPAAADGTQSVAASDGGERRHLTILFCDLVGSVTLAAQVDPEEWRGTLSSYQRAAAEAITRYGGEVVRYVGDGIMAFFGYPVAHDNDAERAARAGLAIVEAIAHHDEQPEKPKLAVRIGIDSGLVVVGTAAQAVDAYGDTANIAARVQALAEPGTVAVTAATHRLFSGLFVVEDRGPQTLKGIERPVQLYRVVRPSGMRSRFEAAAAAGGLTPFVGREDELRSLLTRWERTREGSGQVVVIIGEAGIGKSRLMRQFQQAIAGTLHTWLEAGAGALYQNTPFYPVSETLRRFTSENQDPVAGLVSRLDAAGLAPTETIPLLAPLLNLPLPSEYRPSTLPPDQQRRRLLAALVEWLLGSAQTQPLISVIEDLHWADPSTLELIQLLAEQGATVPLMLLYTARPEFQPSWPLRAHHTQITLNRLSAREVRTVVAEMASRKALSDETIATVVERTGGVPLFVEELTRAVLDSGYGKLVGRAIPVTLHDSLMARLDRLGSAKEVAQVGAVIGAEFSYELLHAVHSMPETELKNALRGLTDAELLYVRGIAPEATYQFKHALIRDAAYEALLKSRRKELHFSIARAIEEKFANIKENHPEVLAQHWAEAAEAEPAIAAWQRAGERAVERRAYREAEQNYHYAIAVLQALPESPERDRRELILQLALGEVMIATQGFGAVETEKAYARARALTERTGENQSLETLFGVWNTACNRGEWRLAQSLSEQILKTVGSTDNPPAQLTANFTYAQCRHYLGALTEARVHFLKAIGHYREDDFRESPNDLGINSLLWMGVNEWYSGYPARGLGYLDDARSLARRLNKPLGLAFTQAIGALTYVLCGDLENALSAIRESQKLGIELRFPWFEVQGKLASAWIAAKMGEHAGAAELIRAAIAEYDVQKFFLARTWNLWVLAETQAIGGSIDDALITLEQALETNLDELLYRPLALRLRGELRRRRTDDRSMLELAERDFGEAINLSRSMSAKSLELRATTSLASLLRDTGRREEARTMLAEIYNWFTEGFDTADLRDAKALLDELSA
jgi:class 3 adenylate cyclase/tetratricopeptide (TPR) repeat protein